MDDPKRNEVLVRTTALREHPTAAATLRLHRQVRAGEQAHALFVRPEARRVSRSEGRDARKLLAAERELQ